jgi:DNA-binding transcriptional LysR family regulator
VRFFLEKVLPELRVRAPEVELELEITQRQVDLVREGFDLALRGSERLEDSSLVARKLMTQEFRLFASPFYLANRGVPKTHADLAAHDLIAFAPGMRVLPWDLRAKDERVKLTPRSWLRANELGVLQLAITQGLGIGMCDPVLVAKEVERGQLQRVLPEYAMPGGSLFAVYPSRRRVPAKVRVFLELLQLHLVAR